MRYSAPRAPSSVVSSPPSLAGGLLAHTCASCVGSGKLTSEHAKTKYGGGGSRGGRRDAVVSSHTTPYYDLQNTQVKTNENISRCHHYLGSDTHLFELHFASEGGKVEIPFNRRCEVNCSFKR